MGTRRKAREAALQFLFQDDFKDDAELSLEEIEQRFEIFCQLYQVSRKARDYCLHLVKTTIEYQKDIDEHIASCAKNWRLERISVADRNILRISICEMLYSEDVPHQVAINEAVEIAKRFGSDDSPSFINGILDSVKTILSG